MGQCAGTRPRTSNVSPGEAEARHLRGQALAEQRRDRDARSALEKALALRRRIGDPRAEETQRLLDRLTG